MPKPLRIEHPGGCYHVICRGNARLTIFQADSDKELLLRRMVRGYPKAGPTKPSSSPIASSASTSTDLPVRCRTYLQCREGFPSSDSSQNQEHDRARLVRVVGQVVFLTRLDMDPIARPGNVRRTVDDGHGDLAGEHDEHFVVLVLVRFALVRHDPRPELRDPADHHRFVLEGRQHGLAVVRRAGVVNSRDFHRCLSLVSLHLTTTTAPVGRPYSSAASSLVRESGRIRRCSTAIRGRPRRFGRR